MTYIVLKAPLNSNQPTFCTLQFQCVRTAEHIVISVSLS